MDSNDSLLVAKLAHAFDSIHAAWAQNSLTEKARKQNEVDLLNFLPAKVKLFPSREEAQASDSVLLVVSKELVGGKV